MYQLIHSNNDEEEGGDNAKHLHSSLSCSKYKEKRTMVKIVAVALVLALCLYSGSAWILPTVADNAKDAFQKAVAVAGVSIALSTTNPLPADAATSIFAGSYSDPKHPNCLRQISVKGGTGNVAIVSGTDGAPGCPPDGSGKEWTLFGKIDGKSILVDFSPKGGPPGLKGQYDDTNQPYGIAWPDGNKWAKK